MIMTIFLENRGNPNAVDEFGRTPAHYAAAIKREYTYEKLKLLLAYEGNCLYVTRWTGSYSLCNFEKRNFRGE
jgi:hypothetical protein